MVVSSFLSIPLHTGIQDKRPSKWEENQPQSQSLPFSTALSPQFNSTHSNIPPTPSVPFWPWWGHNCDLHCTCQSSQNIMTLVRQVSAGVSKYQNSSHWFICVFIVIFLGDWPKNMLLWFMSKAILAMFSSRSFIVSGLIFRSLVHFEFIFLYGVKKCSTFILLHVALLFSQHHLLKRLSFFLTLYVLSSFVTH